MFFSYRFDTLFETFGARPFVPIKHISAFDFVYHPTPKKFDPFLFFFTQVNPHVLYSKPHAFIVSNASCNLGNVAHIKSIELSVARLPTGNFSISACFIVE